MYAYMYLYIFVVAKIKGSNITIFENDGVAVVHIERSEKLDNDVMIYVATVDGTAKGWCLIIQHP